MCSLLYIRLHLSIFWKPQTSIFLWKIGRQGPRVLAIKLLSSQLFIFSSVHKGLSHDSKAKPKAKNTNCQSGYFVVTILHKNAWKMHARVWSAAIEITWNHNCCDPRIYKLIVIEYVIRGVFQNFLDGKNHWTEFDKIFTSFY